MRWRSAFSRTFQRIPSALGALTLVLLLVNMTDPEGYEPKRFGSNVGRVAANPMWGFDLSTVSRASLQMFSNNLKFPGLKGVADSNRDTIFRLQITDPTGQTTQWGTMQVIEKRAVDGTLTYALVGCNHCFTADVAAKLSPDYRVTLKNERGDQASLQLDFGLVTSIKSQSMTLDPTNIDYLELPAPSSVLSLPRIQAAIADKSILVADARYTPAPGAAMAQQGYDLMFQSKADDGLTLVNSSAMLVGASGVAPAPYLLTSVPDESLVPRTGGASGGAVSFPCDARWCFFGLTYSTSLTVKGVNPVFGTLVAPYPAYNKNSNKVQLALPPGQIVDPYALDSALASAVTMNQAQLDLPFASRASSKALQLSGWVVANGALVNSGDYNKSQADALQAKYLAVASDVLIAYYASLDTKNPISMTQGQFEAAVMQQLSQKYVKWAIKLSPTEASLVLANLYDERLAYDRNPALVESYSDSGLASPIEANLETLVRDVSSRPNAQLDYSLDPTGVKFGYKQLGDIFVLSPQNAASPPPVEQKVGDTVDVKNEQYWLDRAAESFPSMQPTQMLTSTSLAGCTSPEYFVDTHCLTSSMNWMVAAGAISAADAEAINAMLQYQARIQPKNR